MEQQLSFDCGYLGSEISGHRGKLPCHQKQHAGNQMKEQELASEIYSIIVKESRRRGNTRKRQGIEIVTKLPAAASLCSPTKSIPTCECIIKDGTCERSKFCYLLQI
jgi:hypothetical protein